MALGYRLEDLNLHWAASWWGYAVRDGDDNLNGLVISLWAWFTHTHIVGGFIYLESFLLLSHWNQLKEWLERSKNCKNSPLDVHTEAVRLKVAEAECPRGFYHETTHRDQEWDLLWCTAQRLLMATFLCMCGGRGVQLYDRCRLNWTNGNHFSHCL